MMTIKIRQEIISVELEDIKINKAKNIHKYHISRKGTARKNPEFERWRHLPKSNVKVKKFDIEVERIGGI